jgi:hypothetical protein
MPGDAVERVKCWESGELVPYSSHPEETSSVSQLRHAIWTPTGQLVWRVGEWVGASGEQQQGSSPLSILSGYISSIVVLVVQALCF